MALTSLTCDITLGNWHTIPAINMTFTLSQLTPKKAQKVDLPNSDLHKGFYHNVHTSSLVWAGSVGSLHASQNSLAHAKQLSFTSS